MGRWRSRRAPAAAALAAACVLMTAWSAPGVAAARSVNVTIGGSLTLSWTSDPGRGCAAAGLCGVTGSLEILPSGSASASGGPVPLEPQDPTAVARVVTRDATGTVTSTCADIVPVDFTLSVRASASGLRAVVPRGESFQPPSSGRCAGPTTADLAGFSLPARRLGGHGYDFSGTTSFGAGPFDITADSTLHARVTYGSSSNGGGLLGSIGGGGGFTSVSTGRGRPARTRAALQEFVQLDYRVRAVQGSLSAAFSGLPAPLCAPLGACGDSGTLTEDVDIPGTLQLGAARIVSRAAGAAAALDDLHRGRLRLSGGLNGPTAGVTIHETLQTPGAVTCVGAAAGGQLALTLADGTRTDTLELTTPGGQFGPDPLRTECPGPSAADVLGSGSSAILARAPLSPAAMGRRRLTLTLSNAGTFSGLSWSGSRSGNVVVALSLVRVSAGTRRVQQVVGQPGVTLP